LSDLDEAQTASDLLYPLLGTLVAEQTGAYIPGIVGLPHDANEDQLKALGAAAASRPGQGPRTRPQGQASMRERTSSATPAGMVR
jgi:hypothetical protein